MDKLKQQTNWAIRRDKGGRESQMLRSFYNHLILKQVLLNLNCLVTKVIPQYSMQAEKCNGNYTILQKDSKTMCSHLEVHTHIRSENPLEFKKTKILFCRILSLSHALQFSLVKILRYCIQSDRFLLLYSTGR